MMRRFGLREDQWEWIRYLLPRREGSVGVTAADNRLFVEAVLYRYRTGMPWRDLPERFGGGTKVHLRFSRRAKSGVWEPDVPNLVWSQLMTGPSRLPSFIRPARKRLRRAAGLAACGEKRCISGRSLVSGIMGIRS